MPRFSRTTKPHPITIPHGPTCATCLMGGRASLTHTPPGSGFMTADGQMQSGVMIVAEALGAEEADQMKALVGPSGFLMGRAFSRKGWGRDEFRYANTLYCKPTDNKIRDKRGQLYGWAQQAITHCASNLDKEIDASQPKCIVALGQTAFERLTGVTLPLMAARGYVWREKEDRCWVVPTFHPAFLLRGQQALTQVLLWDVQKARRVAAEDYSYETPNCLMNPSLEVWEEYVADFLRDPTQVLAFDIETPWKRKHKDDDDEADQTEDITYNIDCISFAFERDRGVTVPWAMPYVIGIAQMLQAAKTTIVWNRAYDRPRVMKALGIDLPLTTCFDAMDCWHVAFNSLPRKLGFATACLPGSFHLQAWKHLSSTHPAYYSVMDSIALWRNWQDCQSILGATGQSGVYDLFCKRLDPVLEHMSLRGMPINDERRLVLREELRTELLQLRQRMDDMVPEAVKSPVVWKTRANAAKGKLTLIDRLRREGDGMAEIVAGAELFEIAAERLEQTCGACGMHPVTKVGHTAKKTIATEGAEA